MTIKVKAHYSCRTCGGTCTAETQATAEHESYSQCIEELRERIGRLTYDMDYVMDKVRSKGRDKG